MEKRLVQVFAVLVAGLAILGLGVSGRHLFNLMNVDLLLDILRVGLAALLIYAGFFTDNALAVKNALLVLAVIYLGLAVLGIMNSTLWGLLPTGLTGFDIAFHLVTGFIGLAAALHIKEGRHALTT
jgi:hypothetical protein